MFTNVSIFEMKNVLIIFVTLVVTVETTCPASWTEEWTRHFGHYLKQMFIRSRRTESRKKSKNEKDLEICEPVMTNLTCKVSASFGTRLSDLTELFINYISLYPHWSIEIPFERFIW